MHVTLTQCRPSSSPIWFSLTWYLAYISILPCRVYWCCHPKRTTNDESAILKKSGLLSALPPYRTLSPEVARAAGHWPLHKMSITPTSLGPMTCIDIQANDRGRNITAENSKELQDFWGIPALNRNNQPIEMRVLPIWKIVATDALIGCIPICARHSTKSSVKSPGFVRSEPALLKKPRFPQDVIRQNPNNMSQFPP
jgi:hypothetical protein